MRLAFSIIMLIMFYSSYIGEIIVSNKGYLHVSIRDIYFNHKSLLIVNSEKDTIAFLNGKNIFINKQTYDIIEQEHLYKKYLKVNVYDPDYSLFILKSNEINDNTYEVEINDTSGYISIIDNDEKLLNFKTDEQHVLDAYPNLFRKKDTPLRKHPCDDSEIIENYMDYTYIPIKIEGDWLMVKDNKDCYIGEEPSKEDITGWVKWRENGEIIIDLRFSC